MGRRPPPPEGLSLSNGPPITVTALANRRLSPMNRLQALLNAEVRAAPTENFPANVQTGDNPTFS